MTTMDPGAGNDADGSTVLPRVGKRGAPQAFARKLYEILTTESEELISWNTDGTAFHVKDVDSFSVETLTKYYRHSKFSSFQRQLNLYSFRKIVKGPDAGGYSHPMFHRDRPDDLYKVRRSISGSARYEPKTSAAATARRSAGRVASKSSGGAEWLPLRSHKSSGASRRVGKIRGGANAGRRAGARRTAPSTTTPACAHRADHGNVVSSKVAAATAATADTSAGERSPWTSGESSDSDVSVRDAAENPEYSSDESDSDLSEAEDQGKKRKEDGVFRRANMGTVKREGILASRKSDANQGRQYHGVPAVEKQATTKRSSNAPSCGKRVRQGNSDSSVNEADGDVQPHDAPHSSSPSRNSPFTFFKKTFSFMEKHSNGRRSRSLSSSSLDMTAVEQPATSSTSSSPSPPVDDVPPAEAPEDVSQLMVDTSASARAAAAGVGVRPPPVSVTGRFALDPTTAAGNKVLTSSPLTPKSSAEAAAAAAATAAAAGMPPPPKREQREELGLVEQLTNMIEVFDICDLLRKVSNSNSSRLDKHGGIVKSAGGGLGVGSIGAGVGHQSNHTRNMSVESSPLPQSPQTTRDGQAGLGSLESMELVRDSSKEWDMLMAGSADVSDLSNTMVQSVAEFFSF